MIEMIELLDFLYLLRAIDPKEEMEFVRAVESHHPVKFLAYLLTKGVDLDDKRASESVETFYFLTTIGVAIEWVSIHPRVHDRTLFTILREHLLIRHTYGDEIEFAKYDFIGYPPDRSLTYLARKVINTRHFSWLRRLIADRPLTPEEQLDIFSLGWVTGNQQVKQVMTEMFPRMKQV